MNDDGLFISCSAAENIFGSPRLDKNHFPTPQQINFVIYGTNLLFVIYAAYTKPKMHVVSNIIRNKYLEILKGVQDDHEKISLYPANSMTSILDVRALI